MGDFLKKYQKRAIRRIISEDIIVREPTKEQFENIENIIKANGGEKITHATQLKMTIEIIKYCLVELCNYHNIDEYSDEEIVEMFDNGTQELKMLGDEIDSIICEVVANIQRKQENMVKILEQTIKYIEDNKKVEGLKESVQAVMGSIEETN